MPKATEKRLDLIYSQHSESVIQFLKEKSNKLDRLKPFLREVVRLVDDDVVRELDGGRPSETYGQVKGVCVGGSGFSGTIDLDLDLEDEQVERFLRVLGDPVNIALKSRRYAVNFEVRDHSGGSDYSCYENFINARPLR